MSDESIPSPGPTDEHPRVVLLIEDDEAVRRSLQLLLHWRGYDVRSFASAGPVLDGDGVGNIDVLVTDYRLPDGDGIGVLRALRRSGWSGKAILITAFPSTVTSLKYMSCSRRFSSADGSTADNGTESLGWLPEEP